MGFPKILIKTICLVSFGCVFGCNQKQKTTKKELKENQTAIVAKEEFKPIAKDSTITSYPKYVTKNYVLGKFDYTKNTDFTRLPKGLSSKEIYLRKDVLNAFKKMNGHAKKDGVFFKIVSGTRNFAHQKRIWDYKWNDKYKSIPKNKRALKILEYSSMPGTSRHHWGTDMDINNLENSYFAKGKGKKEYDWLVKNANIYGFYQVYTSKRNGRKGYNEEKWHWSYLPLSSIYLDFYNKNITHKDIKGFKGSEFAPKINMIKNYVNGINTKILEYKK